MSLGAALEAALMKSGQTVRIERTIGTGNSKQVVSKEIRAKVIFAGTSDEQATGLETGQARAIISPVSLRGWMDTLPGTPQSPRPSYPKLGDSLWVDGAKGSIAQVMPIMVRDQLVRFEMIVNGISAR